MIVHLEHLFHFCCGKCLKWWTVADIAPELKQIVTCPHCGHKQEVEAIEEHPLQS
jgi:DNA-directed RNA polymerase subunit RPC12/RpoP